MRKLTCSHRSTTLRSMTLSDGITTRDSETRPSGKPVARGGSPPFSPEADSKSRARNLALLPGGNRRPHRVAPFRGEHHNGNGAPGESSLVFARAPKSSSGKRGQAGPRAWPGDTPTAGPLQPRSGDREMGNVMK